MLQGASEQLQKLIRRLVTRMISWRIRPRTLKILQYRLSGPTSKPTLLYEQLMKLVARPSN